MGTIDLAGAGQPVVRVVRPGGAPIKEVAVDLSAARLAGSQPPADVVIRALVADLLLGVSRHRSPLWTS